MREFFRGWRRKVGCALLLMACVCMTLWLLSLGKSKYVTVTIGKTMWVFRLEEGHVKFLSFVEGDATAFYELQPPALLSGPTAFCNFTMGTGEIEFYENEKVGSLSGVTIWGLGSKITYRRTVPLWIVTIPLILLSAYLILWKRRKPEDRPTQS